MRTVSDNSAIQGSPLGGGTPQPHGDGEDRPGSAQPPGHGVRPLLTRERVLVLVLLLATLAVVVLSCWLVLPFLPALSWALALAVVAHPLHRWLAQRFTNKHLAAGLAVVLVVVLLVLPGLFIAEQLRQEVVAGAAKLEEKTAPERLRETASQNAYLAQLVSWLDAHVHLEREVMPLVRNLLGGVFGFLTGSVWALLQAVIALYLLFYFFRDGRQLLAWLRGLVPLSRPEADEMTSRITDTIHGTVKGILMVACVQGALGGLMFWFLGLPSPILWAVVMAGLSVVPFLGSFVVWFPTAIYLALSGNFGQAAVLALWGLCMIGLVDNLLYPILVGKQLHIHPLLAFVGIVGGVAVIGAAGVILGPVLVALALFLVDIWRSRLAESGAAEEPVTQRGAIQDHETIAS
jgi:predicted PurR-regulated permease PerM